MKTFIQRTIIAILGIFCFQVNSQAQTIIFEDDFESGSFGSAWTARPSLVGTGGFVQVVRNNACSGEFAVRIGRSSDGGYTTNALDLAIDLTDQEEVLLDFCIYDYDEDNHVEDGLFFSDDAGLTFTKVLDFRAQEWCKRYGKFPPIDVDYLASIHGLNLNAQFVIRFQQHDNDNFSSGFGQGGSDGFHIDHVKIYDPNTVYANLPFNDDFEAGRFGNSWTWSHADSTIFPLAGTISTMGFVDIAQNIGQNSSYGVRMGARCDRTLFATNALDLHLNLKDENQVALSFWIRDIEDNTQSQDGLYFSDNGGESFVKVLDFKPSEWCNHRYGRFPTIDIDYLAVTHGLNLTDRFVIRFQQHGKSNFVSGFQQGEADGIYIDNVKVYDPQTVYTTLPFRDDFETARLEKVWGWSNADSTIFPLSSTVSTMGRVEVGLNVGRDNSYGVRMGAWCDRNQFTTNALDLHLNLKDEDQVALDFWIRDIQDETHKQDGLYFSDNAGESFAKVLDFKPNAWCDHRYGKFPTIDVDHLASINGLKLTDQFIIRFQQHDNSDFNSSFQQGEADGMFLDDIRVYNPNITYATIPFSDGFEAARLSQNWSWNNADSTIFPLSSTLSTMGFIDVLSGIGIDNSYAVRMGSRCDRGSFATNALDLHVDLKDFNIAELSFQIRDIQDETHTQDGIYLSVDGGRSFKKIYDLKFQNQPDHLFVEHNLDLIALASQEELILSDSTIIRFQQHDNSDFISGFQQGERDGIYLDNVSITGIPTSINSSVEIPISIYPNPVQDDLIFVELPNQLSPMYDYTITDMRGRMIQKGKLSKKISQVDVSSLSAGVYQLVLDNGQKVARKKIVRLAK